MLHKPLLSRFVVIGMNDQQSVGAVTGDLLREIDGSLCAVGTAAGNDRNPLLCVIDAELADIKVLLLCHCRGFTRRTADDNSVGSMVNLKINQIRKGVIVDRQVFLFKRSHNCYCRIFKNRHFSLLIWFFEAHRGDHQNLLLNARV